MNILKAFTSGLSSLSNTMQRAESNKSGAAKNIDGSGNTNPVIKNENPNISVCNCPSCRVLLSDMRSSQSSPKDTSETFDNQNYSNKHLNFDPCKGNEKLNEFGKRGPIDTGFNSNINDSKASGSKKIAELINPNSTKHVGPPITKGSDQQSISLTQDGTPQVQQRNVDAKTQTSTTQSASIASALSADKIQGSESNVPTSKLLASFNAQRPELPNHQSNEVKLSVTSQLTAAGLADQSNIQQNMSQLADQLQGYSINKTSEGIAKMSERPQTAHIALKLTSGMLNLKHIHAQGLKNIMSTIPQIPQKNIPSFLNIINSLPHLKLPASNMVLLTSVIGKVIPHVSEKLTQSLANTLQVLSENGLLDSLSNDLNKMAALQALLIGVKGKDLDENQLLALIAPLIQSAAGEETEETKKLKREKKQAQERMIQFLETYVGTGFAIWAEQMNLNKEEAAFIQEMEKSKKQLHQQVILLQRNINDEIPKNNRKELIETNARHNNVSLFGG